MATVYTDTLFKTKYKDDFADSDGYYRILFNSGRSLQARELTQMQTIIQKQIERFGNNIFKEGAVVKPGGLIVDNAYEFVKLDTTSTGTGVTIGEVITGSTSGLKAEVLERIGAENGDPVTLYVKYVNTTAKTAAAITPRFLPGENLGSGRIVQITNTTANPAVGRGTRVSIGQSIYFTQGFFVFAEAQAAVVAKYNDAPNLNVGFKITQQTYSVDDDLNLYDNQGSTINTTAPGADRYKITLTLTSDTLIDSDENFIHVTTLKNGAVITTVQSQQDLAYNIPRDMIAVRIKENSGDYIVRPFRIDFEDDSQDTHLILKASDGIAVVDGYRAARYSPTDIRIAKSTSTILSEGEFMPVDYGYYVNVAAGQVKGGPDISTYELLNIRDAVDYGGSTIGTVRVRAIRENGVNYRYHLFDLRMNSGKNFRDARSIGTSITNYFNPTISGTNAIIEDPLNHTLVYSTLQQRPKIIDPKSMEVQILRSGTSDASGNFTVSIPTNYVLNNTGDWMIFHDSGQADNGTLGGIISGASSTTITGLPPSTPIKAYVYGSTSSPVVRAKTLVTGATVTTTISTDAYTGEKYINLGKPDIYDVTRIRLNDSDGADVSYKFSLDDGQRDNYYGLGRMVLKDGQAAPGGNVYVKFDHFNHGAGNFFAVNSYTGVVDYDKIPSHTFADGQTINLRDAYDFRPVVNSSGNFTEANLSYLPVPTDLIVSDNTYYLATGHKLVIDTEGNFDVIVGEQAFNPSYPKNPEGTLPLYNFILNPNTLNHYDVSSEKIDHQRYTMDDINHLEKRIEKLEEITSLNMLELATNSFEVLDSAGLNRTKSGFFVDNFTTHILSDVNNPGYRASIDPSAGLMRPAFTEDNIRLIYDSDNSANVVKKGDNIYLNYIETPYVVQPWATKAVKINPYGATNYNGTLTLSPASDEWRDKNILAKNVIDGGTKLSTKTAVNWNNWEWNWGGKELEDLKVGDFTNTITKKSGSTTTTAVNKVVKESVVEEKIGTRVVQVAMLPWMRSRIISIRAQGLRPNSNVYLFMGGKNMENYVREAPFVRYSSTTKDYGNTLKNKTVHPDGAGTLTTNNTGAVDISFMIPNNGTHRFRCGTHEIKILDITADNEEWSGTIARAIYTAKGWLDTIQETVKSTRVLEIDGRKTTNAPVYNPPAISSGKNVGDNPPAPGSGGGYWTTVGLNAAGERIWAHSSNTTTTRTTNPHTVATRPVSYTDRYGRSGGGSTGDTSSSSSSNKIVCTEMYRQTQLENWAKAMKIWDTYQKRYLTPYHEIGYHWLFKPYVRGMQKSGMLTRLGAYLAEERTQHLKHVLTKGKAKDSLVGNIWCKVIHPVVHVAGRVKTKIYGETE